MKVAKYVLAVITLILSVYAFIDKSTSVPLNFRDLKIS